MEVIYLLFFSDQITACLQSSDLRFLEGKDKVNEGLFLMQQTLEFLKNLSVQFRRYSFGSWNPRSSWSIYVDLLNISNFKGFLSGEKRPNFEPASMLLKNLSLFGTFYPSVLSITLSKQANFSIVLMKLFQ